MEKRFKTGILRDCNAVYSCNSPAEPGDIWQSVAVFNISNSKCRAEINVQQSTLTEKGKIFSQSI